MKNKHMTLDDRIEIQECLTKGISFKNIGKRIGKSATTISREVKQHIRTHSNGYTKTDKPCPHLLKAPLYNSKYSELTFSYEILSIRFSDGQYYHGSSY